MKYIGSRYVPKFMGTYDNTQIYEALCVVDNGSGTSYISQKIVPAGTPLTDTTYWAVYGASSGAIINLQDQIDDITANRFYVTPQMFGAVGDGITDDSQAFIDCFAGGNKYIIIPEGDYVLNDEIEIGSNTYIVCNGTIYPKNSTTVLAPTAVFKASNKSNIIIDGLKIEGTGAINGYIEDRYVLYFIDCDHVYVSNSKIHDTPYQYAISFVHSDYCTVNNCHIEDYTFCGIGFGNTCNHSRVLNCIVIESHLLDPAITDNSYPITVSGFDSSIPIVIPDDIVVDGCYIFNSTGYWEGIDFHGGSNVRITNNTVIGALVGIACAGASNFKANDVIIANNILIGNATFISHNAGNWGISVSYCTNAIIEGNSISKYGAMSPGANSPYAIYAPKVDNIEICNNTVFDCAENNAYPYGIYYDGDNALIHDNYFHDCLATYLVRFFNTKFSIIKNNTIEKACTSMASYNGIDTAELSYNRACDNVIDVLGVYDNLNGAVPQFGNTVSGRRSGHYGDIIYNSLMTTGSPIGWICTKSEVSGTPATWVALPNL